MLAVLRRPRVAAGLYTYPPCCLVLTPPPPLLLSVYRVCMQCGFPVRPRLRVEVPSSAEVLSIVWRDNLNRTVALDSREVELPPLQPLDEASASNTEQCNTACDWRYHVSVYMSASHNKAAPQARCLPKVLLPASRRCCRS